MSGSATKDARVLVVIVDSFLTAARLRGGDAIADDLQTSLDLSVATIDELVSHKDLQGLLSEYAANRLVVCTGADDALGAIQAVCRRAGVDPLGVEVVRFGGWSAETDANGHGEAALRALGPTILAAAAKARAFAGSRPENARMRFSAQGAVSRRGLFSTAYATTEPAPTINRDACHAASGCSRCVEACPHGVLTNDEGRILVDADTCTSCGVCVAECPWRAVELPHWSAPEVEAAVAALLPEQAAAGPAVMFTCQHANAEGGRGWVPVPVPCQAYVTAPLLLSVLARGAAAIGVRSCGDRCNTGRSDQVRQRVAFCREVLRAAGRDATRVVLAGEDPPPADGGSTLANDGLTPRTGTTSQVFGWQAASTVLADAAARFGLPDLALEHPGSPLGRVEIDEDSCTLCATCCAACPTDALSYAGGTDATLLHEPARCIACGSCVAVCPEIARGAVALRRETDLPRVREGAFAAATDSEVHCVRCGRPFASTRMLERLVELLGELPTPILSERCPDCRNLP